MKKIVLLVPIWFFLQFYGCQNHKNTITQISTIDALLSGQYDGLIAGENLLHYGNFGIGTFNRLDGEMIILDNKIYQMKADAKVYEPKLSMTMPFAVVNSFASDLQFDILQNKDIASLQQQLDEHLPNQNVFYALKINGVFHHVKTRSIPAQNKPYPPLSEAAKGQITFNYTDTKGTLVGFKSPAFAKGINVPGYHLHFINEDRNQGGHVLDIGTEKVTCYVDICDRLYLILPEKGKGLEQVDLSRDRSDELQKIEK